MRVQAEAYVEGEQYADMLPPLDLSAGVPAVGDELVVGEVAYTCTKRSFAYDTSGRIREVALTVRPL